MEEMMMFDDWFMVLGSLLSYLYLAGITFALCPESWDESRFPNRFTGEPPGVDWRVGLAVFWPVTAFIWAIVQVYLCGPRTVGFFKERIPRARVVKR